MYTPIMMPLAMVRERGNCRESFISRMISQKMLCPCEMMAREMMAREKQTPSARRTHGAGPVARLTRLEGKNDGAERAVCVEKSLSVRRPHRSSRTTIDAICEQRSRDNADHCKHANGRKRADVCCGAWGSALAAVARRREGSRRLEGASAQMACRFRIWRGSKSIPVHRRDTSNGHHRK